VQAIADQDAGLGDLATVWDTDSSALLSAGCFRASTDSARKCRVPNLKLMFRPVRRTREEIEIQDSPKSARRSGAGASLWPRRMIDSAFAALTAT
jgi:hypothetical protein